MESSFSIPVDRDFTNMTHLIKEKSEDQIYHEIKYWFDLINEKIETSSEDAPTKTIWIKRSEANENFIQVGFTRKTSNERKNKPRVKLSFDQTYTLKNKLETIQCIITNACREWGADISTKLSETGTIVSFSVNGTEHNLLFEI